MDRKHCGEKEKLLVTSIFYFSHSVFKRLVLQTCKIQVLFGKELYHTCPLIKAACHINKFKLDTLYIVTGDDITFTLKISLFSSIMLFAYLGKISNSMYGYPQIYRTCHELTVEIKFY